MRLIELIADDRSAFHLDSHGWIVALDDRAGGTSQARQLVERPVMNYISGCEYDLGD